MASDSTASLCPAGFRSNHDTLPQQLHLVLLPPTSSPHSSTHLPLRDDPEVGHEVQLIRPPKDLIPHREPIHALNPHHGSIVVVQPGAPGDFRREYVVTEEGGFDGGLEVEEGGVLV